MRQCVVILIIALVVQLPAPFAETRMRWIVYYGRDLPPRTLGGVQTAILEPENIRPDHRLHPETRFIGYVSVGEANVNRSYAALLPGRDFLVEENPIWKGSWRVDVRAPSWQKFLLEKQIPHILKQGYDGLFLDTVDTALYLEEKDPKRFRGSKKAMVRLVERIRHRFPKIVILPNNGLELLNDYGREIDGVVIEDLYTRYDFTRKVYGPTPLEETAAREQMLDAFRAKFSKPVFNILYDTSATTDLARRAIARSESKGYLWYLTTVDLMKVGTVMP